MNFNKQLYRKTIFVFGVLTPIVFVLRLITYFSELDVASGFFHGNGTLCTVYNILGFCVFFLSLFLSFSKKGTPVSAAKPKSTDEEELLIHNQEVLDEEELFPQYFHQGFTRKTVVWNGTLSAFATFLPGFGFLAYALSFFTHKSLASDAFGILFSVLSVLSGVYFIFTAIRNSPERDRKQAFFAMLPALWCTARLVTEYRDLARFVNKNLYIGQFLFLISAMIFFLYQAQLLLGEESLTRPNSYAFTAIPVVFFGLTARFPQLIAGMADRVRLDLVDASGLLIDLAITLYVIIKVRAILKRSRNS
ncbi:MAG: hypothetical protein IKT50_04265 [Clostridia bacterium]|nr:hypothetical protein [Clostridia bacterium]